MMGFLRAAYVVGRRDFVASVYSRYFIFFLMGPLIIIGMSILFGSVTQKVAQQNTRTRVAVVLTAPEYRAIAEARDRLADSLGPEELPEISQFEPKGDQHAQVRALLDASDKRIVAVLTGSIAHPTLTGAIEPGGGLYRHMTLIIDEALRQRAIAASGHAVPATNLEVVSSSDAAGAVAAMRAVTAGFGQLFLFFLTVLLSGMLLSNMLEEKSNKVIEVLAAAIPVDAIFVGKIVSMLAISLVGVTVWAGAALAAASLWGRGGGGLPPPAVGWPAFMILLLLYFSVNYLLLGALFLGIGSQAGSVREVQTLSMPITVGQMLIFAFASFASTSFNSPLGIAAAAFPFSSPLTMIARAAQTPELWPHAAALVWQGVWVWLVVRIGSSLFRRNVLKSGGGAAASRG